MKKKLVVLLLTSMVILPGCGTPNTPTDSANGPDSVENQKNIAAAEDTQFSDNQTEETQTENTDNAAAELETTLQINEEGVLNDWSITVTNAEITDTIKENDYYGFTPEDGNKYLFIEVSITNNGKDASTFLPSISYGDTVSAKVLYQQEYEYSPSMLLGYSNDLHNTSVNPLSTKTGAITFELPDSIASTDEELILQFSGGKSELLFKVR